MKPETESGRRHIGNMARTRFWRKTGSERVKVTRSGH